MSARRVLLFTHWAPNVLVFRRRLLELLLARGTKVLVVAPGSPDYPRDELRAMGAECETVPGKPNALDPLTAFAVRRALRAILRSWEPDAILSFSHYPNVAMAGALDGAPSCRWFATVTGLGRLFQPARSPLSAILRRAASRILVREYRRVGKLAAGVLTLNPDDLRTVRSWSPELCEKATLLPLGEGADVERFRVDAALRAEWRRQAGFSADDVVCAFVGRFMREKGVETFLDLAEADRDSDRRWLLVGRSDLGGDGDIDLRIGELRNAGKLRVLPWQNDLRPLYNGIDFLIHPSIGEGMPVAPIEAMGCGASILLLDAPGSRELPKAGEGCRLLRTNKPGAWLSALDTWSTTDRAERAAAARATAKKFDSRLAAAGIARILDGEAE
ncbi:MAG: glycosyltransferase [Fibrobacterales bacterium]|nr:glycosyltransferase [Fibrobacterales bacterium]